MAGLVKSFCIGSRQGPGAGSKGDAALILCSLCVVALMLHMDSQCGNVEGVQARVLGPGLFSGKLLLSLRLSPLICKIRQ